MLFFFFFLNHSDEYATRGRRQKCNTQYKCEKKSILYLIPCSYTLVCSKNRGIENDLGTFGGDVSFELNIYKNKEK